ncbi:MAG: DUF6128 domain-containing protein [Wujia sp.]
MQQGRWVSYIYRYRDNVRCENAGFIKVQRIAGKKEDDVRIQIGLKLYKRRPCVCTAYLLYDGDKAKYLTDIRLAAEERDTIMSRVEVPWDDPLQDGMDIRSYDGLFFRCDDGEMLTGLWNEYELVPGDVKVVDVNENRVTVEAAFCQEPDIDKVSRQGDDQEDVCESECIPAEGAYENQLMTVGEDAPENEQTAVRGDVPGNEQAAVRGDAPENEQTDVHNDEAEAAQRVAEGWKQILETHPKLPLFADSQFIECVKIVPQDIGKLPISNWRLGVNSFVSHGYYHYRYLMLGRVRFEQGECVVIGVPGVFSNKEKYLANMFGFDTFVPVKKSNVLTGNFGYWVSEVMRE